MSTVTKPDKEQLLAERNKKALRILRAADAKAAKIAIDAEMNISTRRRQALKVRSDAVPEAVLVLAGKDA